MAAYLVVEWAGKGEKEVLLLWELRRLKMSTRLR